MLFLDFYYLYAAALLLVDNKNPYDIVVYSQALATIGYPATKAVTPFLYPPGGLWLFYLLGLLPFWSSLAGFLTLCPGTLAACYYKLRDELTKHFHWCSYPKLILLFLLFPPFLKGFLFGQISWVPYAGYCIALLCLRNKSFFLAGLCFSLLTIKPQAWILVLGFILGFLNQKDKRTIPMGFILGCVLQMAISYCLFPEIWNFLISEQGISTETATRSGIYSIAPVDLLVKISSISSIRYVAIFLSFFLGVYFSRKRIDTGKAFLYFLPVLSLLGAPFSWGHDYIVLFPVFLLTLSFVLSKYSERVFLLIWTVTTVILLFLLMEGYEVLFLLYLLLPLSYLSTIYKYCAITPEHPVSRDSL